MLVVFKNVTIENDIFYLLHLSPGLVPSPFCCQGEESMSGWLWGTAAAAAGQLFVMFLTSPFLGKHITGSGNAIWSKKKN